MLGPTQNAHAVTRDPGKTETAALTIVNPLPHAEVVKMAWFSPALRSSIVNSGGNSGDTYD